MKTRLRKASRNFSIPQQLIWPRKQTQACGLIAESPQALIAGKMNQAVTEAQLTDCHSLKASQRLDAGLVESC